MPPTALHSPQLLVACLCAEWCGTCRDFRPLFENLAQTAAPGEPHVWIDIEEHAEVLAEHDIETFPTLLIADDAGRVLFFGPVLPQGQTLARLLETARSGGLKASADAQAKALAARVRTFAALDRR